MHRYCAAAAATAAGPGSSARYAIRDFPSNTEKWGIFFGRRRERVKSSFPLSVPHPDNQPFPKSVNKDFLRDGSEGGRGGGGRVVNFRDALELFGIRQMRNENRRRTDGAPRHASDSASRLSWHILAEEGHFIFDAATSSILHSNLY